MIVLGTSLHSSRAEVVAKLEAYVQSGGTAVLTASVFGSFATVLGVGIDARNASGGCTIVDAGAVVTVKLSSGYVVLSCFQFLDSVGSTEF